MKKIIYFYWMISSCLIFSSDDIPQECFNSIDRYEFYEESITSLRLTPFIQLKESILLIKNEDRKCFDKIKKSPEYSLNILKKSIPLFFSFIKESLEKTDTINFANFIDNLNLLSDSLHLLEIKDFDEDIEEMKRLVQLDVQKVFELPLDKNHPEYVQKLFWYLKVIDQHYGDTLVKKREEFLRLLWEENNSQMNMRKYVEEGSSFSEFLRPHLSLLGKVTKNKLSGKTLLPIFAQVFSPVLERMELHAPIEDIQCFLGKCNYRDMKKIDSDFFHIYYLLSGFVDPQQKQISSLKKIEHLSSLKDFFALFSSKSNEAEKTAEYQHVYDLLVEVYPPLKNSPDLSKLDINKIPTHAIGAFYILKKAQQAVKNYLSTGLHKNYQQQNFSFGFTEKKIENIMQLANTNMRDLSALSKESAKVRSEILLARINEIHEGVNQSFLKDSVNRKQEELLIKLKDLEILRKEIGAREKIERTFTNNMWKAFELPSKNEVYKASAIIKEKINKNITADLANEYSLDNINNWNNRIEVKKGDSLQIVVSGQWSPLCNLKKAKELQLQFNNNADEQIFDHVTVGPEGFHLNLRSSDAFSHADRNVHNETTTLTDNVSSNNHCFNHGCNKDQNVDWESSSKCTSYYTGNSTKEIKENTTTTEKEAAKLISYEAGLRLPTSPMPQYPVGSLILLQVVQGADSKIIKDAWVLHSANNLIFEEDSEIFFLINDCAEGNNPNEKLQLEITHRGNFKEMFEDQSVDLLKIIESLNESNEKYFSKGKSFLSMQEMQLMKSEALKNIEIKIPTFNQWPLLKEFTNYLIDEQIMSLDKKTKINKLEEEIKLLSMELKALEDEAMGKENVVHLREVYKWQIMANYDEHYLATNLQSNLNFILRRFLQVVKMQFPELISNNDVVDAFRYIDIDLNSQILTIIDGLNKFFEVIKQKIEEQKISESEEFTTVIGYKLQRTLKDSSQFMTPYSSFNSLFWNLFEKGPTETNRSNTESFFILSINPEELYELSGYKGMRCHWSLPVIEAVGLGFISPQLQSSETRKFNIGKTASLQVVGDLNYLTPQGLINFKRPPLRLSQSQFSIFLAESEDDAIYQFHNVTNLLHTQRVNLNQGWSLFTQLSFDLQQHLQTKSWLKQNQELFQDAVILFKVRYQQKDQKLSYLKSCIKYPSQNARR